MNERNINTKQLEAYQFEVRAAQDASESGKGFEFPQLPKFMNVETKTVLMAYRNMARVWSNAGAVVPNVFEYRALLLIMGCNKLKFERRPRHDKAASKSAKQVDNGRAD